LNISDDLPSGNFHHLSCLAVLSFHNDVPCTISWQLFSGKVVQ
jgi:hypothetical protein